MTIYGARFRRFLVEVLKRPGARQAYLEGRQEVNPMRAPTKLKDLSGALSTVLNILEAWQVSIPDRLTLLGCDQVTFDRWTETRQLNVAPSDTVERLSYLLGIWKSLHVLFPDAKAANTWIHRDNDDPLFGGAAPLSMMIQEGITGLATVRLFLDGRLR